MKPLKANWLIALGANLLMYSLLEESLVDHSLPQGTRQVAPTICPHLGGEPGIVRDKFLTQGQNTMIPARVHTQCADHCGAYPSTCNY